MSKIIKMHRQITFSFLVVVCFAAGVQDPTLTDGAL